MRVDPGNDAAQDLALSAALYAVAQVPVEVDAAAEEGGAAAALSLRGRMLARQVDRLRIAAGAEPEELQRLARALAHDHHAHPHNAARGSRVDAAARPTVTLTA